MKAIYLEEAVDRFIEQGANLDKDQIIYILNRLPYMEIVRCKDCRFYVPWDDTCGGCEYLSNSDYMLGVSGDNFCSYGERSEE